MRIATIVGRVTLSVQHPSLVGKRMLVALPWSTKTYTTGKDHDYSIIAADELGANVGQNVTVCESTEATRPFKNPTPCDAYCGALLDEISYESEAPTR